MSEMRGEKRVEEKMRENKEGRFPSLFLSYLLFYFSLSFLYYPHFSIFSPTCLLLLTPTWHNIIFV